MLTRSVPINSFTFYTISSGRVGCACHWREMLPAFGILSKWIQDGAGISLLEATWKATWSGPLVIQTLCSRLNSEILMERGQTERPTGKNSRLDGLRTEWKRRCGVHLQSHVLFHVLGREHAENSFCFVCDPDVQTVSDAASPPFFDRLVWLFSPDVATGSRCCSCPVSIDQASAIFPHGRHLQSIISAGFQLLAYSGCYQGQSFVAYKVFAC